MKKIYTYISLFLLGFIPFVLPAQNYTGHGYAGGVNGAKYQMPGEAITAESGEEVDVPGIVTPYYFDIANTTGPSLSADENVTFGLHTGTGSDTGGQDKRGYVTNSSTVYTPIRWNGGSKQFRQSGQWVRFSIDFEAGNYNFIYRGNVLSYAIPAHKFDLKIFSPSNMGSPIISKVIDLTDNFPTEGAIGNNILRIGGGNADTDWMKVLDDISITTAGTYVIELSTGYFPYSFQPWSCFTFNKAASYEGKPFEGTPWKAGQDTIKAWQYDKVGESLSFSSGDKDVSVGIYGSTNSSSGTNIRNYTDDPQIPQVRWNTSTQTFQANGGWYNYTTSFEGRNGYFFVFRAVPLLGDASWNATIRILEPKTKHEVLSFGLADGISFVSDNDANQPTRWMYINTPVLIPDGQYLVQIDFPVVSETGILGEFTFSTEHPRSGISQVINYNWPTTIPESNKYAVKVFQNGNEYDIFTHMSVPDIRPSTYPDDDGGNGIPTFMYDRTFSFAQLAFTDEILVEVTKTFGTPAHRVEIQPKAYGINPVYFDGTTVRFYLKHQTNKPSYIGVTFISDDNTDEQGYNHQVPLNGMMLFADKPEIFVPDKNATGTVIYNESVTAEQVQNADLIYFPAGDYNLKDKFGTGTIKLTKNGQRVYLEGGAYVRGAIWSEGFDDLWLYGRGIITGADLVFHELLNDQGEKEAYLKFIGSDNCHFEGITITDPCHHSIPSGANSYFKNMKIIGWSYNADGTRVGSGSFIEEMFYHTMDDRDYGDRNHIFRNSVLWPMRNGAFSILGWGPYDGGKATYENLYFINSEWDRPDATVGNQGVIGSKNKQGSNIANDTIRNLYLEDYTTILTILRHEYDSSLPWDPNDPGEIKDFLFENIKVENPFIKTSGEQAWQRIEGFEHNGVKSSVHDITFRNLVVAGELITNANKDKYFKINSDYAYNIFFETSGTIHTLRATAGIGGKVFPAGDIAVPNGTSQYVSIQPDAGYRIKNVKVDNHSVGRLQNVFLKDLTSDHLVEVEFEEGQNTFDLADVIDPNTVLSNDIDLGIDYPTHSSTSIKDVALFSVYPNPASHFISVEGLQSGAIIQIYSPTGQLVHSGSNSHIDISGLDAGIYLVKSEANTVKLLIK